MHVLGVQNALTLAVGDAKLHLPHTYMHASIINAQPLLVKMTCRGKKPFHTFFTWINKDSLFSSRLCRGTKTENNQENTQTNKPGRAENKAEKQAENQAEKHK